MARNARTRGLAGPIASALSNAARAFSGSFVALVELAEDHLDEALAGVVGGELLERRDGVLEVRALVRAGDHHGLDEAALAVRGLLRELDRLREVRLVVGRRRDRREVVDAHREVGIGGHDLLRQLRSSRAELEVLDPLLQLERGPASPRPTSSSTRTAFRAPPLRRRPRPPGWRRIQERGCASSSSSAPFRPRLWMDGARERLWVQREYAGPRPLFPATIANTRGGRARRERVPESAQHAPYPEARRARGERPQAGHRALPLLDAPDERGDHALLPRVGPAELRPDLRPPDLVHAHELPHGGADRGGRRPLREEGVGGVRRLPARRGLDPLRDLPPPRGVRRRRGPVRGGDHARLGRGRGARLRLAPRAGPRGRGIQSHGSPRGGEARGHPRGGARRRRGGLAARRALADAPPGRAPRRSRASSPSLSPSRPGARRRPARRRATCTCSPAACTTSDGRRSCAPSRSTRWRAPPWPGS